jgi:hypothetical protein
VAFVSLLKNFVVIFDSDVGVLTKSEELVLLFVFPDPGLFLFFILCADGVVSAFESAWSEVWVRDDIFVGHLKLELFLICLYSLLKLLN